MSMPFELDENKYESGVNIKVIGVGGACIWAEKLLEQALGKR